MDQQNETVPKRTLVFRYLVLTVMTFMLTTMVVLSFWFVFTWENYMLHYPGLWVSEIDNAGSFWGLSNIRETGQLTVWKIDSSSAAASTGITSGDTIIGINGVKLRDKPEAYFGAFVGIKQGQQIDIELLKKGEPLHKKLTIERNYGIDRPKGYLGITSYWSGFDSSLAKSLPEQGVFIKTVVPDAPAEKAGIKPGDVILRFNTVRLFASYEYTTLIENSTPGQTVPIQLLRGDSLYNLSIRIGSKEPQSFNFGNLQVRASLQTVVWSYYNAWTFMGVLLIIVGGVIGWMRPRDRIAFTCSLMFLGYCGAILAIDLPFSAALPMWLSISFVCFSILCNGIAIPFGLRLFSMFPSSSSIGRLFLRWQWVFFVLYGFVALYATLNFLAGMYSWNLPWPLISLYDMQSWIYIPLLVVLGGLILSQRAETRHQRHIRLRIIEFGIVLSLGSMILAVLVLMGYIPESWGRNFGSILFYLIILGFSGLPISFAYTILTRKVFDIRFIIRKGLRYLLLSKGAMVIEGIIVFLIVFQVITQGGENIADSPFAVSSLSVGSTLAVMFVLGKFNRKLMPAIDRRFFREALDVRKLLLNLNQQLSAIREREQILQQTANTVLRALHPARIIFLLKGEKNLEFKSFLGIENEEHKSNSLTLPIANSPNPTVAMLKSDDTIIKQMEEKKGWVIVTRETLDLEKDEDQRLSAVNCELLIGLRGSSGLIGVMGLGDKLSEEPYSKEDRELLLTVAHEMGMALENAELLEVAKREAEFSKELDIARQVQQNLFPKKLPTPTGWEFAGICKPAKAVGGDYYDIFEAVPGKVVVALGDVSGKGLGASFLMSSVHGSIRTRITSCINEPLKLIEELNAYLLSSTSKNIFVTLFFGIIDLKTGKLSYVNCGHPPAIVIRQKGNKQERLTRNGPGLSMLASARYTQGECLLQSEDSLIVYSDGVTEAKNNQDEMYDEERLSQLLSTVSGLEASTVMEKILSSVEAFASGAEQADDISLVVILRQKETLRFFKGATAN